MESLPSPTKFTSTCLCSTIQCTDQFGKNDGKDNGGGIRTYKRLEWTKDEELRLVNAWLENTNNPIDGICKKTGRYWGDVANHYNSTTPRDRIRSMKPLKDHFQKIKKRVAWFCSAWKGC